MEARIMNKSVQNQSIKRTKKLNYIGTLRNLIKAMKDHHSGLVELLKNSADACLRDNYDKNESLSICFDVAPDVKFISAKETLLTVLFLLVFKNKVDNVKLYFYSKSDNIIHFSAAMKDCDFIETETYKFTSRISFSISEFLHNNYEKKTIADSLKNIKAKYTNR